MSFGTDLRLGAAKYAAAAPQGDELSRAFVKSGLVPPAKTGDPSMEDLMRQISRGIFTAPPAAAAQAGGAPQQTAAAASPWKGRINGGGEALNV